MTLVPYNHMLSDHFSLAEAIASETAARHNLNNTPSPEVIKVMERAAVKLEKVRAALNNSPIRINSWYRCMPLNGYLNSKPTSQHPKGEAIDFIAPSFGTPADICKKLVENKELIGFDQLILEHTWVHISFAILNSAPRSQVLSLLADGSYASGITDKYGKPI